MTNYQIVCTTQTNCNPQRGHIVRVGIANSTFSVADIYGFMDNGDGFYTSDGHNSAWVQKWRCSYCGQPTLRSHPDATTANNLDSLRTC